MLKYRQHGRIRRDSQYYIRVTGRSINAIRHQLWLLNYFHKEYLYCYRNYIMAIYNVVINVKWRLN